MTTYEKYTIDIVYLSLPFRRCVLFQKIDLNQNRIEFCICEWQNNDVEQFEKSVYENHNESDKKAKLEGGNRNNGIHNKPME